jgi:hypothetical protein
MNVPHWTTRLELAFSEPDALRVLDTASIVRVAKDVRLDISKVSVERWIREAVAVNRLQRVVRGLFLNRLIVAELDLRKLKRLAKVMNLEDGLKRWCERHGQSGAPSAVKRQIKREGQVRT